MPPTIMSEVDQTAYLLSFLTILVYRAGGTLRIESLSEFSLRAIELGVQFDGDAVILTTKEGS